MTVSDEPTVSILPSEFSSKQINTTYSLGLPGAACEPYTTKSYTGLYRLSYKTKTKTYVLQREVHLETYNITSPLIFNTALSTRTPVNVEVVWEDTETIIVDDD